MNETIIVPYERAGLELDEFLCLHFPEFSKGFLRRAVREGQVLLDGMRAMPSQRLRADQVLLVTLEDDVAPNAPVAPEAELPILYEDDDLLVVDKPSGLAVEPERWARDTASLAGGLLALSRARAAEPESGAIDVRFRAVHRLDKDTSGALVVAKNLEAERSLRAAFENDEVEKTYHALVEGEHPLGDGAEQAIDMAIGPDERRSGRMRADPTGKQARTRIGVLERFQGFTWMRCRPETGRTHQIRVHMATSGFPLAVDPVYGRRSELMLSSIKAGYNPKKGRPERPLIARLTLHAAAIDVPAPGRPAERVRVEAPLPKDLARVLKQLGKVRPSRAARGAGRRPQGRRT